MIDEEDDAKEEGAEADHGAGRSGDAEGDETHTQGQGEGQGPQGLTPSTLARVKVVPASKRQKQAMREFKDWKRTLADMIRRGSSLVWAADGTYQFVLPPRLVKLVWTTTIKERVKLEVIKRRREQEEAKRLDPDDIPTDPGGASIEDAATVAAVSSIQAEVDAAVSSIVEQRDGQASAPGTPEAQAAEQDPQLETRPVP